MPSSGVKKCARSEEHTSELQSHDNLVCRLLLEKNKDRVGGTPKRPGGRRAHGDTRAYPARPVGRQAQGEQCAVRARLGLQEGYLFFFNGGGPPEISPLSPPGTLPI